MYTYKFTDVYKDIETGKMYLMSEQSFLEELLLDMFDLDIDEIEKVPELFRKMSPEEWAKYAFENNKDYSITYFKNNEIYVIISYSQTHICLDFVEEKSDKSINDYLSIQVLKGSYKENNDKTIYIPFKENMIFLKNIVWRSEYAKSIIFYPEKEKDNTFLEEWIEEDGKPTLIELWGTADLSKHWIQAPKHYLDFEYLLDYKNILNPEHLDI